MRSRKERPKLVPALTRCNIRETAVLSCAFSTWALAAWGRGDNKSPWSEKCGVTERCGECKWSLSMVALGLTILTPKGVESKNSNCFGERGELERRKVLHLHLHSAVCKKARRRGWLGHSTVSPIMSKWEGRVTARLPQRSRTIGAGGELRRAAKREWYPCVTKSMEENVGEVNSERRTGSTW